jgi:hypothetical protein
MSSALWRDLRGWLLRIARRHQPLYSNAAVCRFFGQVPLYAVQPVSVLNVKSVQMQYGSIQVLKIRVLGRVD